MIALPGFSKLLVALALLSSLCGVIDRAAADAVVEGVRLWRAPDNTRIVFDLSGPVTHTIFSLQNPNRLVIDIDNASIAASTADLPLADTPIASIRTGSQGKNTLRVVLDLKSAVDPASFVLAKHGDKSDRLVLDLFDQVKKSTPAPVATITSPRGNTNTNVQSKRDIIIAIDPGHGGEDPGAIGAQRVYEKNVVLDISKQLAKIINATPGYKAELIRTGDYYIALEQRREMARKKRADLFVSIHADAFKHTSAHGASVYALSGRGAKATSDSARFLAQRENSTDLIGGVGDVNLKDKDEALAGVLVDLSMTHTLSSSLEVGQYLLASMNSVAKLHKSHVEQANFAVLRSADMPSVLVETGFISNPGEAKRLSTPKYRQQMAEQIFKGINKYFQNTPPPGTYIAWQQETGLQTAMLSEHIISRGETLSGIAARYNISVADLLNHNNLRSTTIRTGQRLKIPAS